MKKNQLTHFLVFAILVTGIAITLKVNFSPPDSRQLKVLPDKSFSTELRENKETDGPAQLFRHEFIATIDPSTGDVPVERLKTAMDILEQRQRTSRTAASLITWQERGPNNIGGRTRAILIDNSDATGNTVWSGGVGGGLWKTTNFKAGTPTWTQAAGVSANLAITCIAQDPSNSSIIYVGTGEGFSNIDAIRGLGIYKTSTGGTSWSLLASTTTGGSNQDDFNYVQKILVYTNGDVYAATRSRFCNTGGGILKSTNGGSTWTKVIGTTSGTCAGSTDAIGYDIEKSASGDLYAATRTPNSTGRIWKSLAGGTVGNSGTWSNVTPTGTFQRIELACSPSNNNKLYALTQGAGSGTGGTRLSTDGGGSWSTINVGTWCDQGSSNADFTRSQAWYDLILRIKPTDDATVYAGGVDIFKTTNSGTAWSQISQWNAGCASLPVVHADIHAIEFFPTSADEFVVGCDGGLFYSTDGGATFASKNIDYNITQYYGLAIHPTSGSDYMLAGAQDNGSHKFSTAGVNSVTSATGGDGAFCHIDTDNPLFQFTSFTGSTFNRSTDGGTSFTFILSSTADRFINPSDYDAANNIMYCGAAVRNFRRILTITGTPSSASFTNIASSTNHSVSAIKVDPNGIDRVWVAFSTADAAAAFVVPEVYIINTASGAATSTPVTLPAGIATSANYISSIDIETGNSAHIILTLSNYSVTSVWESTDTGATWTSIEGDLPDMPVRWGKFCPASSSPNSRTQAVGGILLATELGVWSTNLINGSSTAWVPNNAVMGNVRADMIVIRASDNKIAVATHGRGVFTGAFSGALPVTLLEFKGTLQNKNILLEWNTSAEYNSKHFELEKSFDGINFRKIVTIPAAGNSNSLRQYSYVDRELLTEKNYYRLRTVDLDNDSKLSNTVLIKVPNAKQDMLVLGNPFHDNITVRFIKAPQGKVELQLMDMSGRLIARQEFGQANQQVQLNIDPRKLSNGVYQLQAFVNGTVFTSKLVRQ